MIDEWWKVDGQALLNCSLKHIDVHPIANIVHWMKIMMMWVRELIKEEEEEEKEWEVGGGGREGGKRRRRRKGRGEGENEKQRKEERKVRRINTEGRRGRGEEEDDKKMWRYCVCVYVYIYIISFQFLDQQILTLTWQVIRISWFQQVRDTKCTSISLSQLKRNTCRYTYR